jgi:3'-phosphoadenosine 5'-phosphosulfate sulfotransferase
MCATSSTLKTEIQQMLAGLYSTIQFQFIAVDASFVFDENEKEKNNQLFGVFIQLRNEFQSLEMYESKLVFPSVIKIFEQKKSIKNKTVPNILELLELTKSKENKLFQLVENLELELKTSDESFDKMEIEKLISIFKTNFFQQKNDWKKLVEDKLNGCACLQKIDLNSTIKITSHEHY